MSRGDEPVGRKPADAPSLSPASPPAAVRIRTALRAAASRLRAAAGRLRAAASRLRPALSWLGKRSTRNVFLRGAVVFSAAVLVAGALAGYLKYRTVWDSIKRIDVTPDLRASSLPPPDPNAINLLLIGSDGRTGENGKIGGSTGISGARSDTDIILHIAPGAHQVVVISIPRDSVVPILNCAPEDGTAGQVAQPAPAIEQINATFAYGGPGCLWETIEHTTGIHINDFIELSFVGFEKAINALGGVNVCLPAAVDDPLSGLDLSAGVHHVWGKEALAFWRTREGVGEGDDPQRIQRDQFLMAALAQGLARSDLLHSPSKILRVIDALTGHGYITTDEQLTSLRLLQIADALRGIKPSAVQFIEVPWTTYAANTNWVQWSQPGAGNLFSAIAHDTRLPTVPRPARHRRKRSARHPEPTATTTAATIRPGQVQVAVFNGSTVTGQAARASTALAARGFDIVGQPANAAGTYTTSVIEYESPAQLPAAQLLAKQLSHVQLILDPQLGSPTLDLILGSTFTGLAAATPSSPIEGLVGRYGGITGNVDICRDQDAFSGPLGY
jgi:LCP family protein required for cell wall assembly